jgi:choline dehydrogenase
VNETLSADVVVVGAGSAGSVVARRLVDAGTSVALIEAGGPDESPAIHDPARVWELWDGPEDWGYRTVPQRHAAGRELHLPRGRVVGGSSSLNGMIYVRGWHGDYDHWAYLGNAGWSWADVLPLFRRSEDFDAGEDEFHGSGGPCRVVSLYERTPLHESFVAGAVEAGIPYNPDHNGASLDGVAWMQLTVRDGRRESAATAFLHPVLDHPGLTVLTRAHARRLVFEGRRCVGVEIARGRSVEVVRAASEVVVSAGAFESPRLLMLSGIGAGDELARLGIGVAVDLPGVGRNLHDHALCPLIFAADAPLPERAPGTTPMQTHLFWRSRPGLVSPDIQPLHFDLPLYDSWMEGPQNAFTLSAGIIRPASRGSVRLRSADPDDALAIDPAYLACEADADAMTAAIELCREIGGSAALAEWGPRELYPGAAVRTAAELRDYARRTVITYHHPVGTCKMGVDELAVVDPELRVHGVEGLRVADASVMPAVTSGNTHAPAMMIGERASDLVLAARA